MAAIITDDFRKSLAEGVLADIANNTYNYFIGIGKSDPWTTTLAAESVAGFSPPIPDGSIREKEEVKENLMALIKVSRTSRVIPRINYIQGKRYKQYDTDDPTAFIPSVVGGVTTEPCYAVYSPDGGGTEELYVCLRNNGGAETDGNDTPAKAGTNGFQLSGGGVGNYQWAYVGTVSDTTTAFNTTQFIAVSTSDLSGSSQTEADTSTGGLVYGLKILNGGSGYAASDSATLVGNNVDFDINSGQITVSGGVITSIDFTNGKINNHEFGGTDWTDCSVVINTSTGSGAEIIALKAPIAGFGFNQAKDLPSYYIGLEASLVGNLEGDAPTIPYRQISLLKGLTSGDDSIYNNDSPDDASQTIAPADTLDALRYMTFGSGALSSVTVTPGDIIEQISGSDTIKAKAFADHIESRSGEDRLYLHQNNSTLINKKSFDTSGTPTIKITNRSGTTLTNASSLQFSAISTGAEYIRKSGEIVFYENRTAINRSAQQTEDVKIVVQL